MPLTQMIRSLNVFNRPGTSSRLGILYVFFSDLSYVPSNQAQPDEILVTKSTSCSRHEWDIIYAGELQSSEDVCMMGFESFLWVSEK